MRRELCLIIIVLFIAVAKGGAQNLNEDFKKRKEKRDSLFRVTPDSFKQQCGDTLYLLYDLTDTLQRKYSDFILLMPHPDKKVKGGTLPGMYLGFHGDPSVLTMEELSVLPWVTSIELEQFHDRETERWMKVYKKTGDRLYKIDWWELFPLGCYFDKVYLIIPTHEGKVWLQEVLLSYRIL